MMEEIREVRVYRVFFSLYLYATKNYRSFISLKWKVYKYVVTFGSYRTNYSKNVGIRDKMFHECEHANNYEFMFIRQN